MFNQGNTTDTEDQTTPASGYLKVSYDIFLGNSSGYGGGNIVTTVEDEGDAADVIEQLIREGAAGLYVSKRVEIVHP